MPASSEKAAEKALTKLRRLPENCTCPNCLTEEPLGFTAVCVPFKTFVCSDCKSAHQSFSHRIKSTQMSFWTADEVKELEERHGGGNRAALRTVLAGVPEKGERPQKGSPMDAYKRFVERAYVDRRWAAPDSSSASSGAAGWEGTEKEAAPEAMGKGGGGGGAAAETPPRRERKRDGKHRHKSVPVTDESGVETSTSSGAKRGHHKSMRGSHSVKCLGNDKRCGRSSSVPKKNVNEEGPAEKFGAATVTTAAWPLEACSMSPEARIASPNSSWGASPLNSPGQAALPPRTPEVGMVALLRTAPPVGDAPSRQISAGSNLGWTHPGLAPSSPPAMGHKTPWAGPSHSTTQARTPLADTGEILANSVGNSAWPVVGSVKSKTPPLSSPYDASGGKADPGLNPFVRPRGSINGSAAGSSLNPFGNPNSSLVSGAPATQSPWGPQGAKPQGAPALLPSSGTTSAAPSTPPLSIESKNPFCAPDLAAWTPGSASRPRAAKVPPSGGGGAAAQRMGAGAPAAAASSAGTAISASSSCQNPFLADDVIATAAVHRDILRASTNPWVTAC